MSGGFADTELLSTDWQSSGRLARSLINLLGDRASRGPTEPAAASPSPSCPTNPPGSPHPPHPCPLQYLLPSPTLDKYFPGSLLGAGLQPGTREQSPMEGCPPQTRHGPLGLLCPNSCSNLHRRCFSHPHLAMTYPAFPALGKPRSSPTSLSSGCPLFQSRPAAPHTHTACPLPARTSAAAAGSDHPWPQAPPFKTQLLPSGSYAHQGQGGFAMLTDVTTWLQKGLNVRSTVSSGPAHAGHFQLRHHKKCLILAPS